MFANPRAPLAVVACPGLHLDSLGRYLAALGLLEVATRRWPHTRGAWGDEGFLLVGGPDTRELLVEGILEVARTTGFRRYDRIWKESQGRDTKDGVASNVAAFRAGCSEYECELLDAHLISAARLCFNPVLGTGGNSGRRDFSNGWADALEEVRRQRSEPDLAGFLFGGSCSTMGHWNAASWFSDSIPAWAMVLACEGLPLLAGRVSRRLGANARRLGAFPFTTEAAAPVRENEAGRSLAEIWAPVWRRPLTVAESSGLFARGRAELGRAQAVTAASFAGSILQRGVDAGIAEFRRYVLTRTTSSQTFESTLAKTVVVREKQVQATADAVERVVLLRERLPRDEQRIFRGLRGPIDEALVDLAANPENAESAHSLMDNISLALDRVDRNKSLRSSNIAYRLLPAEWLTDLFTRVRPPREAIIAAAVASLQASEMRGSKVAAFVPYRLGVESKGRRREWYVFPTEAPQRRVWTGSDLVRDLGLVLRRRLVEATVLELPFQATVFAPLSVVASFLRGELDDHEIARWMSRMSLFNWQRSVPVLGQETAALGPVDGVVSLFCFLKPLFDPRLVGDHRVKPAFFDPKSRTGGSAGLGRIAAQLEVGHVASAIAEARIRYRVRGRTPATIDSSIGVSDPARLLAALLIPTSSVALLPIARRWLAPERSKETSQ